ncbi:hypothetical protein [Kitasatospora sp. NPDC088548]|uniref:hypothetical protein n=1 Tax=Kitasatospora sp. NPDC088548 TaxID=3364075 RepID=UPI00380E3BF4
MSDQPLYSGDAGWFIETEGFRIGPDWYTEAGPFATEAAAHTWLAANRHKLMGHDRETRVTHQTTENE